jgi:SAM-dependent methyltransferase
MIALPKPVLPIDIAPKLSRASRRCWRIVATRIRTLLENAYYRFLFGLKLGAAPSLTGQLAAFESGGNRGDVPLSGELWEAQYLAGQWSFLHDLDQMTRYSVIASYLQALKRHGAVLDVGCGEGVLLERLGGLSYAKFVGVDISPTAVERARQMRYPRSSFVCADAQQYVPDDLFDVIIFNEVLYYFADPQAVVQKFCGWVKADGLLVTSLYSRSSRARAISRLLKRTYRSIAQIEIKSGGKGWLIGVFSPAGNRLLWREGYGS